ncbi:MAG: bifunctional hydroxymethylpyrimidine kinase/phosphomethylpyrimidine kinase [Thermoanaerobaculia bacterium]
MNRRIVWSIGGSDSGGGAGTGADIRTIQGLGAHACTVISAVTAQNSKGVASVWPVPADAFSAQLHALEVDLPPAVVKIGMLATAQHVRTIAAHLSSVRVPVVLDPVLRASAGGALIDDAGRRALVQDLLPRVTVLTPNLDEACALLSRRSIRTSAEIEAAARELAALGPPTVIIKGCHGEGALAQDCVFDRGRILWLSNSRLKSNNTHGTGCTFASALAAALSTGVSAIDATVVAKMYVTRAIRNSYPAGEGSGPVAQGVWPEEPADLPWLTRTAAEALDRPSFPPINRSLGLYAIVDSAQWVERLVRSGAGAVQLRIKSATESALRDEIRTSIGIARTADVPLFINDHWRLAIELGAWGVHLGQEDLDTADVGAIARAGLRLGISTHCYEEVARAHALRPSYTAIGPIFETKIKVMRFAPQGLAALSRWVSTLAGYPLVAIGGIDATNAREVLATGVQSIAVIRAITQAADPIEASEELAAIVVKASGLGPRASVSTAL